MDITSLIAASAIPYISINGFTGGTYTYKARTKDLRHPIVEHRAHERKASAGSMIYLAVDSEANLLDLKAGEKLYVGSQSGIDRMFRGDGMKGGNFHHAQMREGNNGQGLLSYLARGRKVTIYRVSSADLMRLVDANSCMVRYKPLVSGRLALSRGRDFAGYWFEQLILRDEKSEWAWNTQGAHADAVQAMAAVGI